MNALNIFLLQTPVPKDIPLPLPLPEWLLVGLLIISFLLHILFVNLMLGGTLLTLWAELKGMKNKDYDTLGKEIAKTVTVNKSLAVVLGVAPLLTINALYTIYFYSANAMTGTFWIMIIPFVIVAFLLIYWHKYSWDSMKNKNFHIALIALGSLIFLFVPLIFLTNINIMLFPERWREVEGFFSAMIMWNVIPRYLHFLAASLAITGLFLFWWLSRKKYPVSALFKQFSKTDIKRKWYKLALYASLSQIVLGPLNLFTLPWDNVSIGLIYIITTGALIAIGAMYMIWRELRGPEEKLGRNFYKIALALTVVVLFMGTGRHVYRAVSLAPHQEAMAAKTKDFRQRAALAMQEAQAASKLKTAEIILQDEMTIEMRQQIMQLLKGIGGVQNIRFDPQQRSVTYDAEPGIADPADISKKIEALGYGVR